MITKPTTYTREYVLNEVLFLLKRLQGNPEFIYKGEIIEDRPYSYKRYSEWKNEFKNDSEISDAIDKIDGIFLSRAVVGGLKNKLSPVMTKFHLVNNFGWRDKLDDEKGAQSVPVVTMVDFKSYKQYIDEQSKTGSQDVV